ncbi:MAG TPA: hypothetical protein DIS90_11305 [Cytophagales bacterium]|nr:hypothetical protein [Cytophagales bacterium]
MSRERVWTKNNKKESKGVAVPAEASRLKCIFVKIFLAYPLDEGKNIFPKNLAPSSVPDKVE